MVPPRHVYSFDVFDDTNLRSHGYPVENLRGVVKTRCLVRSSITRPHLGLGYGVDFFGSCDDLIE